MKALLGGTLVDPSRGEVLPDAALLVEGDRIREIGPAKKIRVPKDAEVLDCAGGWIMPGLVDAHIHFFQSGGLYTRPDILDLRTSVPYAGQEVPGIRQRLPDTFARYLRCGVTSVVDVGGPFWNFEVRRLAAGAALAPRVAAAGPLISTWQPEALQVEDAPILKASSPEEARAMVAAQAPHAPDLVKVWFIVQAGEEPAKHLPLVRAVAEEAHARGLRLAVHATALETARCAVEAGADILVHSVDDREVDDAFLDLLRACGTLYTTTLMVSERYRRTFAGRLNLCAEEQALGQAGVLGTLFDLAHLPGAPVPPRVLDRIARDGLDPSQASLENLKRLVEAGIPVAAGTDAGNIGTPHGPAIFHELRRMAQAGLTPAQVLAAATLGGVRVMGRERDLGTLEPGKLADILILDADPLADLGNVGRIRLVMKGGEGFAPERIAPDTPEDLAQRQLNAYNARDLEAFLACYAPDVRVYTHPDALQCQGLEAMRQRYGRLFADRPRLHARLAGRISLGDTVIDREEVTGHDPDGKTLQAVAIYRMAGGLIREVRFIR
jgi:imidazolonepropionase-like amidohydrolase